MGVGTLAEPATERREREEFERQIATHEMTVIRDDGLHRHLRFKRPDTGMYYFDLLTWPGHLCISGDASDALVFSRIEDMFKFFASEHGHRINPQYWAEKLLIPGRGQAVMSYSEEGYLAHVREWIAEKAEEMEEDEADDAAAFKAAAREHLLDEEVIRHEETAREALWSFEHDGLRIYEPWEWSLREYDFRYLWSCHAIVWGIEQYRAARVSEATHA